jgi:hypothetical protein
MLSKKSILIALTLLIGLGGFGVANYLKGDTITSYASESDPLNGSKVYVIRPNDGQADIDGKVLIPANVTFVVLRPDELSQKFPIGTTGKVVGRSDVDLDQYLNKEVYIYGDYYDGPMMFSSTQGIPDDILSSKMAVIHVKKIVTK